MSNVRVFIDTPKTAKGARSLFAPIVLAMARGHGDVLARLVRAPDGAARDRFAAEAAASLDAQGALCAIELYLYNQEVAESEDSAADDAAAQNEPAP